MSQGLVLLNGAFCSRANLEISVYTSLHSCVYVQLTEDQRMQIWYNMMQCMCSCFAVFSSKEAGEILEGVQLSITDALSSIANANWSQQVKWHCILQYIACILTDLANCCKFKLVECVYNWILDDIMYRILIICTVIDTHVFNIFSMFSMRLCLESPQVNGVSQTAQQVTQDLMLGKRSSAWAKHG